MAILNKSQTEKQNKDYWRTSELLINDALTLLNIKGFDIDVCCSSEDVQIEKSDWCLTEDYDALSDIDWFSDSYSNSSFPPFTTSFCNPPFSRKWEFFQKAIEQVNKFSKQVLMVLPYTPATRAWSDNVHGQNCIIYVPDGRYQYLLPSGEKSINNCNFDTCLILIVPFKCGNVIVNYKRGLSE
ncbi:DNA N-6-adenine-methyltransferase [Gilliamella sp. BG2]|uniref:DNA N-6-adenine-methyltransferase n=1 Tax=Gilliamella sp. BG2 TaxID=3351509 RepID=UPI003986D57C